jgi:hypothetical protein
MSVGQYPAPPAFPTAPEPPKRGNGIAIAGLILAFLVAPVGLILSIIGLVRSGQRGRRGIAIAGLVISLIFTGIGAAIAVVALKNINTVLDPGCTTAKSAILDNDTSASDPATLKRSLQATISGLTDAENKAQHDNVRTAVKNVLDDYQQLLNSVNSRTQPPAGLEDKLTADANAIDNLCTVGGAQN